jgi:hypothetical protein
MGRSAFGLSRGDQPRDNWRLQSLVLQRNAPDPRFLRIEQGGALDFAISVT